MAKLIRWHIFSLELNQKPKVPESEEIINITSDSEADHKAEDESDDEAGIFNNIEEIDCLRDKETDNDHHCDAQMRHFSSNQLMTIDLILDPGESQQLLKGASRKGPLV